MKPYDSRPNKISTKFIDSDINEIKLDYTILDTDNIHNNIISGIVKNNSTLKPVGNACVKLLSISDEPLQHTFTNRDGYYCFKNQQLYKSYKIISICDGFFISPTYEFYHSDKPSIIDIFLRATNTTNAFIITGTILGEHGRPLNNIKVSLYYKNDKNMLSCTHTDQNGLYILNWNQDGQYTIKIQGNNYLPYRYNFNAKVPILQKNFILRINPLESKGTVTGIIKDKSEMPISNALVVLHDAITNAPINFTYTNNSGCYMFYNIDIGEYYITSTKNHEEVEDNSFWDDFF